MNVNNWSSGCWKVVGELNEEEQKEQKEQKEQEEKLSVVSKRQQQKIYQSKKEEKKLTQHIEQKYRSSGTLLSFLL